MKKSPSPSQHTIPDAWFARYRRDLSPSGDARSVQTLLAIRSVAHTIETKLADWLAPESLSLGQFNVLMALWAAEGGARTMSDISRALVASPASATKLISQLEEDGLVQREADANDKRSVVARLTKKGHQRMELVAPGQIARVESAMACVPGWTCEALMEFLAQVREGFENAPQTPPSQPHTSRVKK